MQMENATRSPSLILPFFQSQDQPHKKTNCMLYMQMENATGPPLHHAGYSFKVKIKCGKDGSVNFKQEDPETCSFFANDPYHIDETVHCKGDGPESQFFASPDGLVD